MSDHSRLYERFMYRVLPAVALLFGLVALASMGMGAMPTATGAALSIVGVASIGLGILLARAVASDFLALRDLRQRFVERIDGLTERARIAVQGRIEIDEPLESPLGGRRCAAYLYRAARPESVRTDSGSGTRTLTIVHGVHFRPCRLVGESGSLRLLALPEMGDELHDLPSASDRVPRLEALFRRVADSGWESTPVRLGRLAEYRSAIDGPIAEDYSRYREIPKRFDDLTLEEKWLPVDEPVCLVGQFDPSRAGIGAGEGPLARGLLVFAGTRAEVLSRLGGDVRGFGIAALVLLAVGAAALAVPLLFGNA